MSTPESTTTPGTTDADSGLATYLKDHYAGSVGGIELAERARGNNEGTPLGEFLARLSAEIQADRETLKAIMSGLGISEAPIKNAGAWVGEKVSRLKTGPLTGKARLGRMMELEMLTLGISGKLALWENLEASGIKLEGFDLGELIGRARSQLAELEPHRLEAAREALSS